MNEWEINIKKVNNGFIVTHENEENEELQTKLVFEDNLTDLVVMQNLLYYIKEYFGCYYSKHNKENLDITIITTVDD